MIVLIQVSFTIKKWNKKGIRKPTYNGQVFSLVSLQHFLLKIFWNFSDFFSAWHRQLLLSNEMEWMTLVGVESMSAWTTLAPGLHGFLLLAPKCGPGIFNTFWCLLSVRLTSKQVLATEPAWKVVLYKNSL
jgi:hypothetical protein